MLNASVYLIKCCWHEFQVFYGSNHQWAYNHLDASCLLQYLLTCATVKSWILLHRDWNVIIFKETPWELTEKIFFQEICPLMNANVRHRQKSHLFCKKDIYLYNLYLATLKTLSTRGGVIRNFPDNINFLEELLFCNCKPFLCPVSKGCFILNKN